MCLINSTSLHMLSTLSSGMIAASILWHSALPIPSTYPVSMTVIHFVAFHHL